MFQFMFLVRVTLGWGGGDPRYFAAERYTKGFGWFLVLVTNIVGRGEMAVEPTTSFEGLIAGMWVGRAWEMPISGGPWKARMGRDIVENAVRSAMSKLCG